MAVVYLKYYYFTATSFEIGGDVIVMIMKSMLPSPKFFFLQIAAIMLSFLPYQQNKIY